MLRLLAALTIALTLPLTTATAADAPTGPVILTVIGGVPEPNRPPFDPLRDAFINYREFDFERAFAFDTAMLTSLPQVEITAAFKDWPAPISASGPLLSDVLNTAGIEDGQTVRLVALDGYGIEFTPADRAAQDWVLALNAEGAPLALGGRGPAWLLHDTGGAQAPEEDESKWVWSVFLIVAD
ncbi:hypothetical protein KHP62_15415 [Rhodobacteraceae bacterium NNCM2]|nr:hypothetical protein [Coraliihabitans acroporae]